MEIEDFFKRILINGSVLELSYNPNRFNPIILLIFRHKRG